MREIERRLSVLEGGDWDGPCLECECERLNRAVSGDPDPVQVCTHRPRTTLFDALSGLNAMEAQHAKP